MLKVLYPNLKSDNSSLLLKIKSASTLQEIADNFDICPNTYILYPHKNAKSVSELTEEELKNIKNIIAIDSTWRQTSVIININT